MDTNLSKYSRMFEDLFQEGLRRYFAGPPKDDDVTQVTYRQPGQVQIDLPESSNQNTSQEGQDLDCSYDETLSWLLASGEYIENKDDVDRKIKQFVKEEDGTKDNPQQDSIKAFLGIKSHLQDELLRIVDIMSSKDEELECLDYFLEEHQSTVATLRDLYEKQLKIQSTNENNNNEYRDTRTHPSAPESSQTLQYPVDGTIQESKSPNNIKGLSQTMGLDSSFEFVHDDRNQWGNFGVLDSLGYIYPEHPTGILDANIQDRGHHHTRYESLVNKASDTSSDMKLNKPVMNDQDTECDFSLIGLDNNDITPHVDTQVEGDLKDRSNQTEVKVPYETPGGENVDGFVCITENEDEITASLEHISFEENCEDVANKTSCADTIANSEELIGATGGLPMDESSHNNVQLLSEGELKQKHDKEEDEVSDRFARQLTALSKSMTQEVMERILEEHELSMQRLRQKQQEERKQHQEKLKLQHQKLIDNADSQDDSFLKEEFFIHLQQNQQEGHLDQDKFYKLLNDYMTKMHQTQQKDKLQSKQAKELEQKKRQERESKERLEEEIREKEASSLIEKYENQKRHVHNIRQQENKSVESRLAERLARKQQRNS